MSDFFIWTPPDPLDGTAKTRSIYMTELQDGINYRRVNELGQAPLTFIDQSIGKKFKLSAVEELKAALNQLAIDFGYTNGVANEFLLDRPYVTITKRYGKEVCHYPILNDLRLLIKKLGIIETWDVGGGFSNTANADVSGSFPPFNVSQFNRNSPINFNFNGNLGNWSLKHEVISAVNSSQPTFSPYTTGNFTYLNNNDFSKTNKIQINGGISYQQSVIIPPGGYNSLNTYGNASQEVILESDDITALIGKNGAIIELNDIVSDMSYSQSPLPDCSTPPPMDYSRYIYQIARIWATGDITGSQIIRKQSYDWTCPGPAIIIDENHYIVNNKVYFGVYPGTPGIKTFRIKIRYYTYVYFNSNDRQFSYSITNNLSFDEIVLNNNP